MTKRVKRLGRDEKGAAMIFALMTLALLTLMGLALLMGASQIMASAKRKQRQDDCYQLAKTMSLALKAELEEKEIVKDGSNVTAENDNFTVYNLYSILDKMVASDDSRDAVRFTSGSVGLGKGWGDISVLVRKDVYTGQDYDIQDSPSTTYEFEVYITVSAKRAGTVCEYQTTYLYRLERVSFIYVFEGQQVYPDGAGRYLTGTGDLTAATDDTVQLEYYDDPNAKVSFWYIGGM